jgi:hypothetical protein
MPSFADSRRMNTSKQRTSCLPSCVPAMRGMSLGFLHAHRPRSDQPVTRRIRPPLKCDSAASSASADGNTAQITVARSRFTDYSLLMANRSLEPVCLDLEPALLIFVESRIHARRTGGCPCARFIPESCRHHERNFRRRIVGTRLR